MVEVPSATADFCEAVNEGGWELTNWVVEGRVEEAISGSFNLVFSDGERATVAEVESAPADFCEAVSGGGCKLVGSAWMSQDKYRLRVRKASLYQHPSYDRASMVEVPSATADFCEAVNEGNCKLVGCAYSERVYHLYHIILQSCRNRSMAFNLVFSDGDRASVVEVESAPAEFCEAVRGGSCKLIGCAFLYDNKYRVRVRKVYDDHHPAYCSCI